MEGIRDKIDTYKIKRKKGYIIGTPIWYVRHAEAYERMLPKWDKEILTRTGFEMNDYFKLMQQIAIAYNNASTSEDKKELREMFMLMYDNITDQASHGALVGVTFTTTDTVFAACISPISS